MTKNRIILAAAVSVFMALDMAAIPTEREILLTQPDGSTFTAFLKGDEYGHILKTSDGCAVVKDDNGYYCYAWFDSMGLRYSSGYAYGDPDAPADAVTASRQIPYGQITAAASARKREVPRDTREPLLKRVMRAKGRTKADGPVRKHGIVILAQFKDEAFTRTKQEFEAMLTEEGYSVNGATGSAVDYFNDQFKGKYEFDFTVSDIVTLPKNRAYYGKNDPSGQDLRAAEMIKDACNQADGTVDFSIFDDDMDGEVDNVFVFYAGGDEAENGDGDCIWSHAWYVKDGADIDLTLDGKRINRYACTSELTLVSWGQYEIATIGTFCHEYSHTFGLPDFYDTDYEGEGRFMSASLWSSTSLMDAGNANNRGNTPPYYNAIEREYLELSEPEILQEGEYILEPISESGRYLKMETATEGEYFLFECRSGKGWDAYINGGTRPASGLLIYHIDKSGRMIYSDTEGMDISAADRWELYNEVNANPEHQCADLIEADGRTDRLVSSIASDLTGIFFPHGNTSFTPSGFPSFSDWDGIPSALSITNIRMDGKNVRFTVETSSGVAPMAIKIEMDVFQNAAIINWQSNIVSMGTAYLTCQGMEEVEVKPYEAGKYSYTIEGLSPGKEYTIGIRYKMSEGEFGDSTEKSFTTKTVPASYNYPYISLPKSGRNNDGSFKVGTKIPLRVLNATDAESVTWHYGSNVITPGKDGYYTITEGGRLKAEIIYPNGSVEIITRAIAVR